MARPLTEQGDLGNARAEGRMVKRARTREARRRDALRWILSDDRGRRWLAELLADSKLVTSTEAAPTTDLAMMREGMAIVGRKILDEARKLDPKLAANLIVAAMTPSHGDDDGRRPGNGAGDDDDGDDDSPGSGDFAVA